MKLTFATLLVSMFAFNAQAQKLSSMNCAQLAAARILFAQSYNDVSCKADNATDYMKIIELNRSAVYQAARRDAAEEMMKAKACLITDLPSRNCVMTGSLEKMCADAIDAGDYEAYQKYCN